MKLGLWPGLAECEECESGDDDDPNRPCLHCISWSGPEWARTDEPRTRIGVFDQDYAIMLFPEQEMRRFGYDLEEPCLGRVYNAMHSAVDRVVANLTEALKRTGLWRRSILLFLADNGGTFEHAGPVPGSSNFPLRGHKYSYF